VSGELRLPRTVVTDAAGERHRVVGWWKDRGEYAIVETVCGKPVLLGGRGNPAPKPCPAETARG